MTITTINRVMGVPIQPVEKAGLKEDRIWMLDSMFQTGRMHVYDRCESLIEELGSVPKERQTVFFCATMPRPAASWWMRMP